MSLKFTFAPEAKLTEIIIELKEIMADIPKDHISSASILLQLARGIANLRTALKLLK